MSARGDFLTRGHEAALAFVRRIIAAERPPHALLLVGPRGVGKTTLATDLAAGLLCLAEDPAARPCRTCMACRKVGSDNHPDLHRLVPEGAGAQIRLGQVQALAMGLSLLALEGRFRVAIISSAQRMNPDAQHALLKTLEEPGPRTCLVLCADETAPLLPTVLSRAARLRLAPLPIEVLADLLVAESGMVPAQARAVALASDGRPGLARALSGHPDALLARDRIARTLLSLVAADRRTRLTAAGDLVADGAAFDAALRGDVAPTPGRLQPAERRRAAMVVLEMWRDVARDLALVLHDARAGVRDVALADDLGAAGVGMDRSALRRFMDRLAGLVVAVESYASPELVLDALLLDWPRPDRPGAARAA